LKKTATLMLALISLCSPPSAVALGKSLPVLRVQGHTQCPWQVKGPAARVFTSAAQWGETMNMLEGVALNGQVDWRLHDVIVFGLKTQSNLGVSVELRALDLQIRNQTALMDVVIKLPPPGSMTLSAVSVPCVVVLVPKHPWQVLTVRDAGRGSGSPKVIARTRRTRT
jgi:hypothetical protein